jgi:hypothetical protein
MKEDLERLIREAQREVRLASGVPLSPEEAEAERRDREVNALQTAMLRELELGIMLNLFPKMQWDGNEAYATFTIDGTGFEVRRDQQGNYKVRSSDDGQELADIPAKDPLLRSRFLAALGDRLAESPTAQRNG